MADTEIEIQDEKHCKSCFGVRHFQCFVLFVTLVIFFAIRTSLSVAIISMTNQTSSNPEIPIYSEWDNTDMILSSFFWGYILPQTAAGQLSEYFGPKWFLFVTMIIGSIFQVVIPVMAASFGSTGVVICRVMQGLNQGFLYPSVSNLISRWTPLFERSRVSNLVFGGSVFGIAVSLPITGWICGSAWGWPAVFYGFGGLSLIWAFIFILLIENSPATHKSISQEEKFYIESSNLVTQTHKKIPTPWRSIFTSLPVYAVLICGFGQCWGTFTLLTEIPSYMSNILHFDISSNSQLSALPYLAQFIMGLISSYFVDKIIEKKICKITTARKIAQAIASYIPAIAMTVLAFLESFDRTLVTLLLIIAVAATSLQISGYLINMVDVAPNHAGTILGLTNSVCQVASLLGPLTVGFLGKDKTDPLLWRKVFLIAAGFLAGTGLFYTIFSSAETQSWNNIEKEEESVDKKY